jgi:hypothetical protein
MVRIPLFTKHTVTIAAYFAGVSIAILRINRFSFGPNWKIGLSDAKTPITATIDAIHSVMMRATRIS